MFDFVEFELLILLESLSFNYFLMQLVYLFLQEDQFLNNIKNHMYLINQYSD